jgi:dTDP-4-dehydrorhamnose 3,5-epimerase
LNPTTSLIVEPSTLEGVLSIQPPVFSDHRGEYVEPWNDHMYARLGLEASVRWKQDTFSVSKHGVVRGLHGDPLTWKLVYCPRGRLLLTVLDVRRTSPTHARWEQFELTESNHRMILIPAGVANGHRCLSDVCIFAYKQSTFYEEQKQFSYRYDSCGIQWGGEAILSERDRASRPYEAVP